MAMTMMMEPSFFRLRPQQVVLQHLADRHAGDAQLAAHAVVRLHQHAEAISRACRSSRRASSCRCRT